MLGDGLRNWFEIFTGIVVYRVEKSGPTNNDGWINVIEFEKRILRNKICFQGKIYDETDLKQKNALVDSLITYARVFCKFGLLECRRNMFPASLDYRVTKLGRRVDSWGYADKPGFRKRSLFFLVDLYYVVKKKWKIYTVLTLLWGVISSLKSYYAAFNWIRNDLFSFISAIFVVIIGCILGIMNKIENK